MSTADGRAKALVEAFRDALEADGQGPVELIETHISRLLLTPSRAYKFKKPLTLPFLDYGTPELRAHYCRSEVELNRRFAPTLYLGVIALGGDPRHPQVDAEPALDHAVEMQRFPHDAQLDVMCETGQLDADLLIEFARELAVLQSSATIITQPSDSLAPALENFDELRELLPAVDQPLIEQLAQWTAGEYARHRADWPQRNSAGFVREGHGDLHLGNLVCIAARVQAFDCIEFNQTLRQIDVINDIAFLWMDLIDRDRPELASAFLNAWLEDSGDYAGVRLLPFYAVYRAMVRAKVAAIGHAQHADATALRRARHYLALGARLTDRGPPVSDGDPAAAPAFVRPRLVITCGLSGSGKTTRSSRWLALDTSARCIRLRSDVERKRLFGIAPRASSAGVAGGIYSSETTRQTFDRLASLATMLLDAGFPVVVDAAFLGRSGRQRFRDLARAKHVGFGILYCEAEPQQLRERLLQRTGDASEATPEIADQQRDWFETLTTAERDECIKDTMAWQNPWQHALAQKS